MLNMLDRLEARLRRGISLFFVRGKGEFQYHAGHVAGVLRDRMLVHPTSSFVRMLAVTPKGESQNL
eukprot:5089034-Karenia_brevis.AAC.1